MTQNIDTLVIGGGIIGLLTARELALAGQSVVILERNTRAGLESSWAGGGILSPLYPWRYPDAVTELSVIGHREYPRLAADLNESTGIDPEYVRSGHLILDVDEYDQAKAWAKRYQNKFSLDRKTKFLSLIRRSEMAKIEFELSESFANAMWMPTIGQIRNPRLVKSLLKDLEQRGVKIITEAAVEKINTENGKVVGLVTSKGRCSAANYLVAAGAWTASLLEETGLSLEIQPVRGQMILFKTHPGRLRRIVLNNGKYLIPRKDGHILAGSTLEYVGFNNEVTDAAYQELWRAACNIAPFLESMPVVKHWSGLRPGSSSSVPVIGTHPELNNLVICSGHFRNGVIIGLASARIAASLLCYQLPRHTLIETENPYAVR